jgi:hypothetical protein
MTADGGMAVLETSEDSGDLKIKIHEPKGTFRAYCWSKVQDICWVTNANYLCVAKVSFAGTTTATLLRKMFSSILQQFLICKLNLHFHNTHLFLIAM